jgi:hypothetical protein
MNITTERKRDTVPTLRSRYVQDFAVNQFRLGGIKLISSSDALA